MMTEEDEEAPVDRVIFDFPRERLNIAESFGCGHFGDIHVCEVDRFPGYEEVFRNVSSDLVLVKSLRPGSSDILRSICSSLATETLLTLPASRSSSYPMILIKIIFMIIQPTHPLPDPPNFSNFSFSNFYSCGIPTEFSNFLPYTFHYIRIPFFFARIFFAFFFSSPPPHPPYMTRFFLLP
jgi:hypothetical protein